MSGAVVVHPRRAGAEGEQPRALGERRRRHPAPGRGRRGGGRRRRRAGSGARAACRCRRRRRHVADAGDRERTRVDVAAELAEMPLDALPGAARGDAELLVVVALGAARGERVAEPEAVLERDRVGGVRERGGALVGRHDEVGIVLVEGPHARGAHDLAADDVVGHVEHAADERRVAQLHLGAQRGRARPAARAARSRPWRRPGRSRRS